MDVVDVGNVVAAERVFVVAGGDVNEYLVADLLRRNAVYTDSGRVEVFGNYRNFLHIAVFIGRGVHARERNVGRVRLVVSDTYEQISSAVDRKALRVVVVGYDAVIFFVFHFRYVFGYAFAACRIEFGHVTVSLQKSAVCVFSVGRNGEASHLESAAFVNSVELHKEVDCHVLKRGVVLTGKRGYGGAECEQSAKNDCKNLFNHNILRMIFFVLYHIKYEKSTHF